MLRVGDLSVRRDDADVTDIVRGYRLTAEKGTPGEVYQFCSGKVVANKELLDNLLNVSDLKIKVTVDPDRIRNQDIPVMGGSFAKAAGNLAGDRNRLLISASARPLITGGRC